MTTDQSARERIAEVVHGTATTAVQWATQNGEYPGFPDATERIIAIVTEALDDPAVIAAGDKGMPPPVQVKRVVGNVLNAAFGEEPT